MRRVSFSFLLISCSEYNLGADSKSTVGGEDDEELIAVWDLPQECNLEEVETMEVGTDDLCDEAPPAPGPGTFIPIVEWDALSGKSSTALPAVGDLDGDGIPEVVVNFTGVISVAGDGTLAAFHGDGSGEMWRNSAAKIGYGSGPTIADIDNDGVPEVLGVRKVNGGFLGFASNYAVVAFDNQGNELWSTAETYVNDDFDYASVISVSDMDHDGSTEIIAGRVIFDNQGNERGKGEHGRGSWGYLPPNVSEASVSAVSDLNLDGVEEVIVGNAMYDPDGTTLWFDPAQADGMIAIGNLDEDPEGEFVASSYNTVRFVDTYGAVLWGPHEIESANIVSPAAIGDIDGDDMAEVIVAGGNKIIAFNHDGTELWRNSVTDESGATGASIFDFEGDGVLDVVYIDEVEMVAYEGPTGDVKFYSTEHSSPTMMDYPVVADVDADGHAEVVVAHSGFKAAFSVYGAKDNSWAATRRVWNQHAYSINNIHDDLSVPQIPGYAFQTHNTWHAASSQTLLNNADWWTDIQGEILDVCDSVCGEDPVYVIARILNRGTSEIPAGIPVTLYATLGDESLYIDTVETTQPVAAGFTGEVLEFQVSVSILKTADGLWLQTDDNGQGGGILLECAEGNNEYLFEGPFCDE